MPRSVVSATTLTGPVKFGAVPGPLVVSSTFGFQVSPGAGPLVVIRSMST